MCVSWKVFNSALRIVKKKKKMKRDWAPREYRQHKEDKEPDILVLGFGRLSTGRYLTSK